ncbi:hypothetical protein MMC11_008405 [Xylographa trunciseda]|nr:hypothetical protein [Xylographa trunciseda]
MGTNIAEAINYADNDFDTEGYTACMVGCGTAAKTSITADDLSMVSDDHDNSASADRGNAPTVPQKRPAAGSSKEATLPPPPKRNTRNAKGKGHASDPSNAAKKGKGHASYSGNTVEKGKSTASGKSARAVSRSTAQALTSSQPLYEQVTEALSKELERSSLAQLGLTEPQSIEVVCFVCGIGSLQAFVQLQEAMFQHRLSGQSPPVLLVNSLGDQDTDRTFARKFLNLVSLENAINYSKLQWRFQLLDLFQQPDLDFTVETQSTMALGTRSSSLRRDGVGLLVDRIIAEAQLAQRSISTRPTIRRKVWECKLLATRLRLLVDEYGLGVLLLLLLSQFLKPTRRRIPSKFTFFVKSFAADFVFRFMKMNDAQFAAFRVLFRSTRVEWMTSMSAALSGIAEEISNNQPPSIMALEMGNLEPDTIAELPPNSDELLDIARPLSLVE